MSEPATLRDVAVIVPTLNAAATLQKTLETTTPAGMVIVCDGGSQDDTTKIATASGARVITTERGRGRQLAAGASEAQQPWLLFLHADTSLSETLWRDVLDHIGRPSARTVAATFRLKFDDDAWQARVLEFGVAARVRLFALPYGDQGLLIHRTLYDAIGGFHEMVLFEDVDIVRRLGRRRLVTLPSNVVTSATKWRRRGWSRQTLSNLKCLSLYYLGVPPERIARIYASERP